jgi:hypothetical protein
MNYSQLAHLSLQEPEPEPEAVAPVSAAGDQALTAVAQYDYDVRCVNQISH